MMWKPRDYIQRTTLYVPDRLWFECWCLLRRAWLAAVGYFWGAKEPE